MLKKTLTLILRKLWKNKLSSFVNLLGLTLAFACCLLVCTYIQNESSYDRWYPMHDRLYRVAARINIGGIDFSSSMAGPPLARTLVRELPEVEKATRIWPWPNLSVKNENNPDNVLAFNEKDVLEADSNFFDLFQIGLIEGNAQTALRNSKSIVLTQQTAIRYFGEEAFKKGEVVGKSLMLKLWGNYRPYQITGICQEPREQTHFDFDILFSSTGDPDSKAEHWLNNTYYTYALLTPGANAASVEKKLETIVSKYINGRYNKSLSPVKTANTDYWHFILQPVTRIHLHSDFESELKPNGHIRNLYIALGTVLLVWMVALLNYINLFTVNNFKRAKEIAILKISGAGKSNVFRNFISESMGIVSVSMILALIISLVSYRWLEPVSPGIRTMPVYSLPTFYLFALVMTFFTGLAGGVYSAAKLTMADSMILIKNSVHNFGRSNRFRQTIVTTQFMIAIVLIVVSVTVSQQLDFLLQKDPGYDQEHVLVMDAPIWGLRKNFDNFKSKLADCPSVVSVSTSETVPGDGDYNAPLYLKTAGGQTQHLVIPYKSSYDFIETLGLRLIEGRDFGRNYDETHSVILSESAVKSLGLTNPVGSSVYQSEIRANTEQLTKLEVIGVVNDVHFESYYKTIRPYVILFNPFHNYVTVRVRTGGISPALAYVEKQWKESYPDAPFHYSFLDKKFDAQYQHEVSLKHFLTIFSTLAILLSLVGLFAIALSVAGQRTKEIGIRKVNGATILDILVMLNKDFAVWVVVALLIGTPAAWYILHRWLNSFAYKTELHWWVFAFSGLLALMVAIATVSWQSWRAATKNPVESLRYE